MISRFLTILMISTLHLFAQNLSEIPFKTADGEMKSLSDYAGNVVILVNVASKCGFTSQYEGLQKLYEEKKEQGLVVLAFPCNDFGGQEPGGIDEIKSFCKVNYGVTFPIMEKIHVKGENQHPLYQAITGKTGVLPGSIKWNFAKIVIDKKGKVIDKFEAITSPSNKKFVEVIEQALKNE